METDYVDDDYEDVKVVAGKFCEKCRCWTNLPDVPYNRIHENVKQCRAGSIVKATTNACHRFHAAVPRVKKK